jgi:nucleotide-binding universal stress UspA family protein
MSSELLVVTIGVVWVAIGVSLGLFMGRRGHDAFSWFVLGAIFGPFAIVLAVGARRNASHGDEHAHRVGVTGTGPTDVVVGIDGSRESHCAVRDVVDLFGTALGRVTLVSVVPFDASPEAEREAHARLIGSALEIGDREVDLHVVRGKPATALQDFVASGGYDVVAVGTRGRGSGRTLLGSVATELARKSRVPVLLFGGELATPTDDREPDRSSARGE